MSAKVAFGAIHGIIPIALFTINAVRNVRPILIKCARVMGLLAPMLAPSKVFAGWRRDR